MVNWIIKCHQRQEEELNVEPGQTASSRSSENVSTSALFSGVKQDKQPDEQHPDTECIGCLGCVGCIGCMGCMGSSDGSD